MQYGTHHLTFRGGGGNGPYFTPNVRINFFSLETSKIAFIFDTQIVFKFYTNSC